MSKEYKNMTRIERVNFLKTNIEFGERMQGGFPYPYNSPIVPHLSAWFEEKYGKYEDDWILTLIELAKCFDIDSEKVHKLSKLSFKSEEWKKLIEQFGLLNIQA